VVYGVKQPLVVPFQQRPAGDTPDGGRLDRDWLLAEYDFLLQPQ
jgi:hydroxyquinol 1,2-dioxygenase